MSPVPGTALLERLRCETADAHLRLESGLDLTGDSIDHARYVALLAAFHGFLEPWEALLRAALPPDERAFFDDRQHAPRAWNDLGIVATATCPTPAVRLAHVADLPVLESAAAAWGSAYVIEGSTLGGRFISAAINKRLGYTPTSGGSYFAGYGAENGRRWNEFRQALETYVSPASHDRAVQAAHDTFESLHRWMVHRAVVT
ncbi:MAG: biliverdin-producing heme oxygenase [Gemmatimonadota bacterium]